jgi:hypothetical protein
MHFCHYYYKSIGKSASAKPTQARSNLTGNLSALSASTVNYFCVINYTMQPFGKMHRVADSQYVLTQFVFYPNTVTIEVKCEENSSISPSSGFARLVA